MAFAPLIISKTTTKKVTVSQTMTADTSSDINYDTDLFSVLKQIRTNEAKRLKVPPYIVFGDKALREMAMYKPKTDDEFLHINGVGDKKLKRFGAIFMNAINEYEEGESSDVVVF